MKERILVVDDDAMNRKMANVILSQRGYAVEVAASGQECLELLKTNPYDLILLDIKMPEMDGVETLEKIREMEKGRQIPVLFLTGMADDSWKEDAERLNVLDVVQKPFIPQKLQERMTKVFEGSE